MFTREVAGRASRSASGGLLGGDGASWSHHLERPAGDERRASVRGTKLTYRLARVCWLSSLVRLEAKMFPWRLRLQTQGVKDRGGAIDLMSDVSSSTLRSNAGVPQGCIWDLFYYWVYTLSICWMMWCSSVCRWCSDLCSQGQRTNLNWHPQWQI